jgi:PAS domain S-box-containing protein
MNEELSAANRELRARLDEISRANRDLQNLLASAGIATIFLDRSFNVKRFTPAAETLFPSISAELGQPLARLQTELFYPALLVDAQTVLTRLTLVEREISSTDGQRHFVARLLPYRSLDDRSEEVVLNFIDITTRKQAQLAEREAQERFRLLVEGAQDYAMFLLNPEGHITFWSAGAERLFGYSEAEALGQHSRLIFSDEDRQRGVPEAELLTAATRGRAVDRRWHQRRDGSHFWADGLLMRVNDESGGIRSFAKVARDATEQIRAEAALQEALQAVTRANEALEQRVAERTRELAEVSDLRQELLRRLVAAQEAEQGRIARDLHDDTGQQIAGLLLGLDRLARSPLVGEPDARDILDRLQALAQDIAQKSHRLSVTLRPTVLDDLGLVAALTEYGREWSTWSEIPVEMEAVGLETRLPPELETTIYRVAQEALTNVLRHGLPGGGEKGASRVSIVIHRRPEEVLTVIEDDGPGFDVDAALSLPPGQRRLGIFGMQERARLAAGTISIESGIGKGTTVYLRLPLATESKAHV